MRVLIALAALTLAAPAAAQLDGKVVSLSPAQQSVARTLSAAEAPLDEKQCAKVALTLTEDRKLSVAEKDWVRELQRNDLARVEVDNADGPISMPVAGEACRTMLGYVVATTKIDAKALWSGSAEDLAVLGTHFHIYPATRNLIMSMIAPDLLAAKTRSNVANAYGPLRESLGVYDRRSAELSGYKKAAARQMMYEIMSRIDRHYDGEIPNFTYNYFSSRENDRWLD